MMMLLFQCFHAQEADASFLLERFFLFFCKRKFELERKLLYQKLIDAPLVPKIIYRLLGRTNKGCAVMLFGDSEERAEYIGLATGYHTDKEKTRREHLTELCVLEGVLKETKELVSSLATTSTTSTTLQPMLLLQVLQLHEAVNLCFFAHEEYRRDTPKDLHWILDFIETKMRECTSSFTMTVEDNLDAILNDIKSIVTTTSSSSSSISKARPASTASCCCCCSSHDPFNDFQFYLQCKQARTTILTTKDWP